MTIIIQKNTDLTKREIKDLRVLALFTSVYCQDHHDGLRSPLAELPQQLAVLNKYPCCVACLDFLNYAIERRLNCPVTEDPNCKHCQIHCYHADHRAKVRQIMRYSGKKLIMRGRLDLLWHYFF